MKALKYIFATMILIAGTAGIQAQRESRTETREANSRTTVRQQVARTAQVRTTHKNSPREQEVRKQQVQKQAVKRQPAQSPDVKRQTVQRQAARDRSVVTNRTTKTRVNEPVSISTRNNPRSDYRSMATLRKSRPVNYAKKHYYSGHHYHHFYPRTHIKIHHHYDTYHHHYRVLYRPVYKEIYWNRSMYTSYSRWYPNYHWRYHYGYRIQTISIFEAKYNLGEVANVYGRVYGTWYNRDTDDYLLFFGGDFPNQQFTVVLPGKIARKYNWRPERFFLGEHITVTGLITTFEGVPEIIVKNRRQLDLY